MFLSPVSLHAVAFSLARDQLKSSLTCNLFPGGTERIQ